MIVYLDLNGTIITLGFIKESKIFLPLAKGARGIFYAQKKEIKSDKLLLWLDQVLKKKKRKAKNIDGIVLGPVGEATFSASRGITNFVNVLGFSLGIPVVKTNTKLTKTNVTQIVQLFKKSKAGIILLPEYSGEPNITAPQRSM